MVSWGGAAEGWALALRAAGRPETTIGLRLYQLRRVAVELEPLAPWEVTGPVLVAWAGGHDWSAETRRSWRSALRSFYGWACATNPQLFPVNPALELPGVRPGEPNPRPAPEDAYRDALIRADERVRLMCRLAAELGLRRGEVARVHSRDLRRDVSGWTLLVHGKGGRVRLLPVPQGLAALILARGLGYVFPGNDHGHLSAHYVGRLVSRCLPEGWGMHSLRHRFGTAAFSIDRDLLTVQELLGHASPVTTRRYVQVPPARARATVAAVAGL